MDNLILIFLFILASSCSSIAIQEGNDFETYKKLYLSKSILKNKIFNDSKGKNLLIFNKCLSGKVNEAVTLLKKEIIKKGSTFELNRNIGNCELMRNNYDRSFYYFDRALSFAKGNNSKAQVFNSLGILYYKRQLFPYADEFFKKAYNLDKDNQSYLYNSMILHIRLAKFSSASQLIFKNLKNLKDKLFWNQMMMVNIFLSGNEKAKLFKLVKKLNDKSNESEFLKLIGDARFDHKSLEELNSLVDKVEDYEFKDPVWKELKMASLQRLEKDRYTYEKN